MRPILSGNTLAGWPLRPGRDSAHRLRCAAHKADDLSAFGYGLAWAQLEDYGPVIGMGILRDTNRFIISTPEEVGGLPEAGSGHSAAPRLISINL